MIAARTGDQTQLVWNKTTEDEWEAGGLGRSYYIRSNSNRRFAVRVRESNTASRWIGMMFATLDAAKRACQLDLDGPGHS